MVNLQKLILSLPWLRSEAQSYDGEQVSFQIKPELDHSQSIFSGAAARHSKSIAIVGAGTSGLTSLRTFLDVVDSTDQDWEIVLFEKRADVGGIWFLEEKKPNPPTIPDTPMHKHLRMNSAHPFVVYPHIPYPPMTDLLPSYDTVWQYHLNFTEQHNLTSYIRFNHTVTSAAWIGNATDGLWNITVSRPSHVLDSESAVSVVNEHRTFDHLVVAVGLDRFPHYAEFPGIDDWLSAPHSSGLGRKVLHSVYYEGPEGYENKTVLVVGDGPSGADVMRHTSPVVRKIYWSFKTPVSLNVNITLEHLPPWHDLRPTISHFTTDEIVFSDGTTCSDVDTVILATGYEMRIPFLEESGLLHVIPSARSNNTPDPSLGLVTNLKYYFPMHHQLLPIVPQFPATALSLVGVTGGVPRFYGTIAQALYLAYAIIDPSILPSREEMLKEVREREERQREMGIDPYLEGHQFVQAPGGPFLKGAMDYMDELVQYLKDRHVVLPSDLDKDGPFVDQWRRDMYAEAVPIAINWLRIQDRGEDEMNKWLRGVETEEEWVELLHRLAKWNGH